MSRSCGLLKWEKGKSYSKFLDKLANGNCHSVYRQMPFGLPAIAVRSTGKCCSVYRQLPFGDFERRSWRFYPRDVWKKTVWNVSKTARYSVYRWCWWGMNIVWFLGGYEMTRNEAPNYFFVRKVKTTSITCANYSLTVPCISTSLKVRQGTMVSA